MNLDMSVTAVSLRNGKELAPRTFFLVEDMLFMRVEVESTAYGAGYLRLFDFCLVDRLDAESSLIVPAEGVRLNFKAGYECKKPYVPGALHVTSEGPQVVARAPRSSSGIVYVSLLTGAVEDERHPPGNTAIGTWTLVAVNGQRETVLAERVESVAD